MRGGHGERDIPVSGMLYQTNFGETYGRYGVETAVWASVLKLVYHI